MNKKIYILPVLIMLFLSAVCYAQVPTYNLRAMNFSFASIISPNDAIEFDIYIQHTNAPVEFQYAGAQFFLEFNSGIIPGNFTDTNIATYRIIGSDLPVSMQPRNPSMATAINPPADILRMAANVLPGAGNGYIMTNNGYPGTKIARMRILSKTGSLNPLPLNLQWRNFPEGNPLTKIQAYIENLNTEITTPGTHAVNDSSADGMISLIHPGYNSSTNRKFIDFSWHKLSNAISYKLQVSTDINFNDIIFSDSSLTDTFKTVSGLSAGSYFWKVSAKNDSLYFTTSGKWFFNIAPARVALYNPPDNDSSVLRPVNFSWYKAGQVTLLRPRSLTYENFDDVINNEVIFYDTVKTQFDFSTNTTYKLEVAADQNFNNIVFRDSAIADSFKTVINLNSNSVYYWRVTPDNDSVFFISSDIWHFNTNLPAVVLLLNSPANNSVNNPTSIDFLWYKVDSVVNMFYR